MYQIITIKGKVKGLHSRTMELVRNEKCSWCLPEYSSLSKACQCYYTLFPGTFRNMPFNHLSHRDRGRHTQRQGTGLQSLEITLTFYGNKMTENKFKGFRLLKVNSMSSLKDMLQNEML